MSWIYKGVVFTDEQIPEGAVGFVYQMTAIIGNQSIAYIGKKNFYATRKKKLSKKKQPVDKRKKTYERVSKLAYHDYYSSNEVLKQAHRSGAVIKREILKICFSKNQLTYEEVKHQFVLGVLESQEFLNGNILGRFYKQK
jgi:butyrate kinase